MQITVWICGCAHLHNIHEFVVFVEPYRLLLNVSYFSGKNCLRNRKPFLRMQYAGQSFLISLVHRQDELPG